MQTQAAFIERRAEPRTPAQARRVIAEIEAELAADGWFMAAPARAILQECLERCRAELRAAP